MNLAELLRKEILRPFITLALPGSCAVWPFALLLIHYHPSVAVFWQTNVGTALFLFASVSLTVGLLLEDFGSRVEVRFWDTRLDRHAERRHREKWKEYLALSLDKEPIAQGYLRSILMRMKFELGLALSLWIMWFGLLWLHFVEQLWTLLFFCATSIGIFALSGYLLWESYESAGLLGELRQIVLNASKEERGHPDGATTRRPRRTEPT